MSETVLDAIHREMRNKKLLKDNSDSEKELVSTSHHEIVSLTNRMQTKPTSAFKKTCDFSEREICVQSDDSTPGLSALGHHHNPSERKTMQRKPKVKKNSLGSAGYSSTSGEEEQVIDYRQDDNETLELDDNELVFMTEQLNRLRDKEKKQKIAEARLTVTEAKLMEFAAKLAARKSKVEENHGRLKNRKTRIKEKEEKIRELELEMNNLDDEIKRRSDIIREREKALRKEESVLNEKEQNISSRELSVSEQLNQIEHRQRIIEKKENMIREMSQLMLNQEMQSTRELNFHTKRLNRAAAQDPQQGGRRHASDDEVYDSRNSFSRSKSVTDLLHPAGQLSEFWVAEATKHNRTGDGSEKETTSEDAASQGQQHKKTKSAFRSIFSNMKKSKSMEKLNGDVIQREIEVHSQSSSAEKENEKPKKRKNKRTPEPPVRKQSMATDHISSPSQPVLLHHPHMMQQLHHKNPGFHQAHSFYPVNEGTYD